MSGMLPKELWIQRLAEDFVDACESFGAEVIVRDGQIVLRFAANQKEGNQ